MTAFTMDELAHALDSIPDHPNPAPLRFYASGPNMERLARQTLPESIEIVRVDKVT